MTEKNPISSPTGPSTLTVESTDIVIVGAGLAGLVAAYEATRAGKKVILVDQENANNLGGQAFWSLGGIFLINSPEQRRLGVKDSRELAEADWFNSAQFDREEDFWPRRWARAYLNFAAGEKREYLRGLGVKFLPVVGWAERGDGRADGHGNSGFGGGGVHGNNALEGTFLGGCIFSGREAGRAMARAVE